MRADLRGLRVAPRGRARERARSAARARAAAERDLPRPPARRARRAARVALVERRQRRPRPARSPLAVGQLARPLGPPLARGAAWAVAHAATPPRRARAAEQAAWQARVAALQRADRAHRALLAQLRRRARARASPRWPRPRIATCSARAASCGRSRTAAAATPRPAALAAAARAQAPVARRRARRCRSPRPPIRSPGTPRAAFPSARASARPTRA